MFEMLERGLMRLVLPVFRLLLACIEAVHKPDTPGRTSSTHRQQNR